MYHRLCHKRNSSNSNQISERNSYIIIFMSSQFSCALHEIGGKRWMPGVAEKGVPLVAKEVMRKLGY